MNEMITSPHEQQNEDYPQLTIADTDWTDEEQRTMRERGYDDMDMLKAWLSQHGARKILFTRRLASTTK